MLENFHVRGFRCFRDFRIEGLKRINLIAGKNSVGKSALLEAIRLYQQPDLDTAFDLLQFRDELSADDASWTRKVVDPLFCSAISSEAGSEFVLDGGHPVEWKIEWRHRKPSGELERLANASAPWPRFPSYLEVLEISFPHGNAQGSVLPLDSSINIRPIKTEGIYESAMNNLGQTLVHMRSGALESDSICELFDRIVGTAIEDEANRTIRVAIPDAERLITKGSGDKRLIFLKRRGEKGPVPLKRCGDGATRVAALALALANCRDGYCLIDEIENGIHYELFDEIWESLERMSRELNVQVIATTHSKDCLDAFERAYRLPEFDACFYRLERSRDEIRSMRMDYEKFFSIVADHPHEVR